MPTDSSDTNAQPAAATPVADTMETTRYETDPLHTFVLFEVSHFGTSTLRARFDRVSGSIELDEKSRRGTADITIDMTSVSSGIREFDEHLRDQRFFDVARHPRARFLGTDFCCDGDKLLSVQGELTLLGRTRPVTLHCLRFNGYDSPVLNAYVRGGDFETTIKRSQWGMNWGLDLGVPDDVKLLVQIEAVKK